MGNKNIKLGFSTGVFHQTGIDLAERINIIKNLGCTALEINFLRFEDFFDGKYENLKAGNFDGFEYVSFHAPKYDYGENRGTEKIFKEISEINKLRKIDAVVFHPDDELDAEILRKTGFPVSFENMDSRNKFWRTPGEMSSIFNGNTDFRLALDLNHAYSNDPAMALSAEFYEKLGDRISHLHLSGYRGPDPKDRHAPLFSTGQKEILKAIKNYDASIIIESLVSPDEVKKEYDYILGNLN